MRAEGRICRGPLPYVAALKAAVGQVAAERDVEYQKREKKDAMHVGFQGDLGRYKVTPRGLVSRFLKR